MKDILKLKDVATGEDAIYDTTVEIGEDETYFIFNIRSENSLYYCARSKYNGIHSQGDAVEILIGTDPQRKKYYEIEVSPNNDMMLAEMTFLGVSRRNKPKLKIDFVPKKDCFVKSEVERSRGGYTTIIRIRKDKFDIGQGDIYFNVYRLETDGGETEKHLFALNPTSFRKFHVPEKFVLLKDYL